MDTRLVLKKNILNSHKVSMYTIGHTVFNHRANNHYLLVCVVVNYGKLIDE